MAHVDVWLKDQIKKGVDKIKACNKNAWTNYYTGYLHKDIQDNFPGKTSNKIFKMYREVQDSGKYIFTQKRFGNNSYEYYVRRSN